VDSSDLVVRVGSLVRVRDEDGDDEFLVVAPEEADATVDRISAESPLGRALLGRRVGERVRFRAPGGVAGVTVVGVGTAQRRASS
jgi:transcription elongation factor GreA